jgi:hypothetical protein
VLIGGLDLVVAYVGHEWPMTYNIGVSTWQNTMKSFYTIVLELCKFVFWLMSMSDLNTCYKHLLDYYLFQNYFVDYKSILEGYVVH